MAWVTGKLSDAALRAAKPTGSLRKLTDGRGLQFWITPQGGRYWRLEFNFEGKRKLLALGVYPEVTVSRARDLAGVARQQIAAGIDPCAERKRLAFIDQARAATAFSVIADKLIAKKKMAGKAVVTLQKMKWILGKVDADLGGKPIDAITTPMVIRCLEREESLGNHETAKRMRNVVGEVFRFAIQKGITDRDPVAATRGILATPKAKHHAAILEPTRLGQLLREIDTWAHRNPVSGAALQLMVLLYPRPGELRQATWAEFDLEKATWIIPADRMKLRVEHVKPLPKQAIEVLKRLHILTGPNGFVFPANGRGARPMSENTMNIALRRMGFGNEHTSHGFRATASTLLNASNHFSVDAIERSLAHQDGDAVRRAYARGNALAERESMAVWWADYLDKLRDNSKQVDNVLPLRRAI